MSLNRNRTRERGSSGSFDISAQAIITAMTAAGAAPDASYSAQINSSVLAMKASGEWDRVYRFYHFAAPVEAQALIDWKSATTTLTKAGTVTHTTNRGFTASGAAADGLQDTFNPSTAGVATNNFSVSVYSRTSTVQSTRIDVGAQNGAISIRIRNNTDQTQFRINSSVAVFSATSVTDATGLWTWSRGATTVCQVFRNGVQFGADNAMTDQAATNSTLNWLNGIIGTNISIQRSIAFGGVSQSRSSAAESAFYNIVLLPLMQWNGANV